MIAADEADEDLHVTDRLYKERRDDLLGVFHGKCAYCERVFTVDQRHGDVEHYHPKGAVLDHDGQLVYVFDDGGVERRRHPGYFWLAYDWENLFPSCVSCNRRGRSPEDAEPTGKAALFPVSGRYALDHHKDTGALNATEKPDIINPRFDNPDDDLRFDIKTGIVCHKTQRGKRTIDLLGLNRDRLPELRKKCLANVKSTYDDLRESIRRRSDALKKAATADVTKIRRGDVEFAAFHRAALESLIDLDRRTEAASR